MRYDATMVHGMLRRVLGNGPLAHLPHRGSDLDALLALAAARLEPERRYTEAQLNDVLASWLESFASPEGVDHVTLRRCLVDARFVRRDKAGSFYELSEAPCDASLAEIDPARVLAEIREERQARKRQRAA